MRTERFNRRVAWVREPGGTDVHEIRAETLPPLTHDAVLVRVEAVGLNHVETLVRRGTYAVKIPCPYAAGIEGSGVVIDRGPDADLEPGTRVAWTAVFGCCATVVIAPASRLARLPDGLDFEAGASLSHAGMTAAGLARHWPLAAGATVVVWGAAGGVGQVLTALLESRGVRVIGIASGERVAAVRAAGAACAVDRTRENVLQVVRDQTNGRGVAAVFDPVGSATYRTSLGLLAPRGCLVNYGQLSGSLPDVDLEDVMEAGSVFVTKYGPKAGVVGQHEIGSLVAETLQVVAARSLPVPIAGRFPLEQVAEAYRALEAVPPGKILILPNQPVG